MAQIREDRLGAGFPRWEGEVEAPRDTVALPGHGAALVKGGKVSGSHSRLGPPGPRPRGEGSWRRAAVEEGHRQLGSSLGAGSQPQLPCALPAPGPQPGLPS